MALQLLFATKRLWGVVVWLKDAGRGLQGPGDRGIARDRVIGKAKPSNAHDIRNTFLLPERKGV
jgi:hypothetical protein